jgi:hypothetical protein
MNRLVYSAIAILFAVGCASEPVLDIELVPDPNINSEGQILERVDTLVFVFDSPDGLYAAGEESSSEGVQIVDADADPTDLELVATFPLGDHLPIARLEQADLPDVAIDVRVLGESGVGLIAEGRALGARFATHGEMLRVPFNIRPEHVPPRVGEVIPSDGQSIQGCDLPTIVVMFSKPIDPASLFAEGAVTFEPGGAPTTIRIDATGVVAQIEPPPDIVGIDNQLSYRLVIETTVTDTAGVPLDQRAAEDESQPYIGDFTLPCTPPTSIPDPPRCGSGEVSPLPPVCPGMPRLMCVDDECVLSMCDVATCESGLVCDPAVGYCVSDCRDYGDVNVCPAERPTCNFELGVCE